MNHSITLLTLRDVTAATRLSKSSIYRRISDSTFPQGIKLGERCRRWLLSDIEQWIKNSK